MINLKLLLKLYERVSRESRKGFYCFFWKFHFSAEQQDLYSKIDDLFHFETRIQIKFYNRC